MAGSDRAVGLLAGSGAFPEVIAEAVKARGQQLVCVQVAGQSAVLSGLADHYRLCGPGALSEVVATFLTHRVTGLLVAGQFPRAELLAEGDALRERLMQTAPDRCDGTLFNSLAALLAEHGINLLDQAHYVGELLAPPGVITSRAPTPEETADLEFGRSVARRLADLDVGQTVVLRRGVILAVEAAEGTDLTIRRGGAMARGVVVVKASRNNQDPKFDIPAVGPETVAVMREVGASALGVDARRTLLLQRERLAASADQAGITIVAAEAPPLGTPLSVP